MIFYVRFPDYSSSLSMYYVNYSASVLAVEPLPSAVNSIKIFRISNRLKIIKKKYSLGLLHHPVCFQLV